MELDHNFYMRLALDEAWKYQCLTFPNPAVGALILDPNGKILSIKAHEKKGEEHAELKAVISALNDENIFNLKNATQRYRYIIKNYKGYFKNHTIYTTLEPCNHEGSTPACSLLIKDLGFSKVVIGTNDTNKTACGGSKILKESGVDVIEGVLEDEAKTLIAPFLAYESKKPFVFFKIATTLNGVYDGGTISSTESRRLVHKIRDKIDLLVIGGESVRNDRPTLDARMANGKAPDILIISKSKNFDQTIPLFKVADRKVFIQENIDKIDSYSFVMIEGGVRLANYLKHKIDWYLIFRSPNSKIGKHFDIDINLKRLHCAKIGCDTISWYKEKD
ncbi:MAG: bifunctional diaminohydroxyphosphoribosylaminopyrimidine deaminase/5-amino-6-(5-phosphoribosylamino)uracil reductase RibD [Sulfurospirillum sp.]|nr:MAG: bifunctional diaminohydroxyphosphoribosylaminopyrimidine deaminase/5-amino-6-(5-phosphoribosylamino)uracil reductase RibD [Sulfurospirillum sp.]